jgi:hypothetical protein
MEATGLPPPWSHGLLMSVLWSLTAFGLALLFYRHLLTSIIIGLLVFSHWVLDYISWSTPLPLFFNNSPAVKGLGTGDSIAFEAILEFSMLGIGMVIYYVAIKKSDNQIKDNTILKQMERKFKKYMIIYFGILVIAITVLVLLNSLTNIAGDNPWIVLLTMLVIIGILCASDYCIRFFRMKMFLRKKA